MFQFDFTCVQAASSARMSIQNGATTDPYIAWRRASIGAIIENVGEGNFYYRLQNPGTRYGKVDAQFNVL